MKLCIPITEKNDLKSRVNAHFGSAACFFVYDTDTNESLLIHNDDADHEHGMCQPTRAIQELDVKAVVCGGMGLRAVQRLNQSGITVYRTSKETVGEVLDAYRQGTLTELTTQDACSEHHCH
jgi:predicted Fe-Mo cluster-binding NifX family protein